MTEPTPASWLWMVGPWSGGAHYPLGRATDRQVTLQLNDASTCSFSIRGDHPEAGHVEELVSDVHALRQAAPGGPRDRVFRGRVGPSSDTLDGTSHTAKFTAYDYREVLARRILWSDSTLTYTAVDQGGIVAALVADTQGRAGGDLGMTVTGTVTGQVRDRTYEANDSIGEKIQQLSEVIDGFDWSVESPSQGELELRIHYPGKGADRGVILSYGDEQVANIERTVPVGEFGNALRVSGRAPEGGGAEPTPVEVDTGAVGTAPEGRWDRAVGTDVTTDAGLTDRAAWLLDEAQAVRPTYEVTLRRGAWRGRAHIDTGDTARLWIRSGRLTVNTLLRVHTITIPVDDDGREGAVSLSLGGPRLDYGRRAALTERRLSDLERR